MYSTGINYMKNRIFIDSNIWLYIFLEEEGAKTEAAKQFISNKVNEDTLVISFQVINEVCNILKRKNASEYVIRETISLLLKICIIQNFTGEVLLLASSIREEYSFSYWDSLIVASAGISGCDMIVSEDMQDGQCIKNIKIKNIFM